MKSIYKHTVEIEALLRRIDVAQQVLASIPKKPLIELRLQRESLKKSALYSARIEGNPKKLADVGKLDKHDARTLEVQNLQRAYSWLRNAKQNKKLVPSIILNLHRIAMNKLSAAAGKFRHEQSAIFNSAGIAVYMPPPPSDAIFQTPVNPAMGPNALLTAVSFFRRKWACRTITLSLHPTH